MDFSFENSPICRTRETLASGNLLSVINVLMQLRKVCNHPNMFETRPTVSPFRMDGISIRTASLVCNMLDYDPFKHIDLNALNLVLVQLENCLSAYVAYRSHKMQTPRRLIEEIDSVPDPAPRCPAVPYKTFVRINQANVNVNISKYSEVRVGTSPAMKTEGSKYVPVININSLDSNNKKINELNSTMNHQSLIITGAHHSLPGLTDGDVVVSQTGYPMASTLQLQQQTIVSIPPLTATSAHSAAALMSLRKRIDGTPGNRITTSTGQMAQLVKTASGRLILTPSSSGSTVFTQTGQRLTVVKSLSPQQHHQVHLQPQPHLIQQHQQHQQHHQHHQQLQQQQLQLHQHQQNRNGRSPMAKPVRVSPLITPTAQLSVASSSTTTPVTLYNTQVTTSLADQLKAHSYAAALGTNKKPEPSSAPNPDDDTDSEFAIVETEEMIKERRRLKLQFLARLNRRKCDAAPVYGADLRDAVGNMFTSPATCAANYGWCSGEGYVNCLNAFASSDNWSLDKCIKSYEQRTDELKYHFDNYVLFVPKVSAPIPYLHISHPHPSRLNEDNQRENVYAQEISPKITLLHPIISAMATQFPDPRLIQYDCGKLQTLDRLLRQLKDGQHRALIFTQMTRMLDVLEAFLNFHGHIYLRLDGSTRIEQRQILMDRFNNDKRIFAFILSTRSGGVGINLTGADTVIFYDSDWNPTMDAQAQDRCHRIGQTRDVNIYRLVSEKTIEENILKKANQKRLLGDLAIEGGNFTTAYFKSSSIQELFTVNNAEDDASTRLSEVLERDRDRRKCLQDNLSVVPGPSTSTAPPATPVTVDERTAIGAFESALAEAEDEQDVQAAKVASAEAAADLAEFDESIPIEDTDSKAPEISKAEQEVENLVKQVCSCIKY